MVGLAKDGTGVNLDPGEDNLSDPPAILRRRSMDLDAWRLRIDKEECDAIPIALRARRPRAHDQLIGAIPMQNDAFAAFKNIVAVVATSCKS